MKAETCTSPEIYRIIDQLNCLKDSDSKMLGEGRRGCRTERRKMERADREKKNDRNRDKGGVPLLLLLFYSWYVYGFVVVVMHSTMYRQPDRQPRPPGTSRSFLVLRLSLVSPWMFGAPCVASRSSS